MVVVFPSRKEWFLFLQEHCLPLALSSLLSNGVTIHPDTSLVLNPYQQVMTILHPQYCLNLSLLPSLCDTCTLRPHTSSCPHPSCLIYPPLCPRWSCWMSHLITLLLWGHLPFAPANPLLPFSWLWGLACKDHNDFPWILVSGWF